MNRETALSGRASAGSASMLWRALLVAAAGALALGTAGCVARTAGTAALVYDYPVVEVEAVPRRIEAYPRVLYRGNYAYLVDGRWYYHAPSRWVVFREEPEELRDARTRIVRDHREQRERRPVHVVPPARPSRPYYDY